MKPLIVALDVETDGEAMALIKATKKYSDIYKVGPTLALRYGPKIFQRIRKEGKKIFLDMKFHDIPNTMLRCVKEAGRNGVFSATVHASAGITGLKTVADLNRRPLIWGVTVLTSLSGGDLESIGFKRGPMDQVLHLADMAKVSGLDGVVASVAETARLRELLGPKFQIITPGIRMPGDAIGDQKRISTPGQARAAGATYMVVGRPLIEATDPTALAEKMTNDWENGGLDA